MYLYNSEAGVTNSTLTGNQGEYAGGIRLYDSFVNVINSTLIGNKGVEGGALELDFNSHVRTVGCRFQENIATDKGAAVCVNNEGEYQDTGSIFTDNIAGDGGEIISNLIKEKTQKRKKFNLK